MANTISKNRTGLTNVPISETPSMDSAAQPGQSTSNGRRPLPRRPAAGPFNGLPVLTTPAEPPTPPPAEPKRQIPKVPQPTPPSLEGLIGRKGITQRPDRYRVDSTGFTVSAMADGVGQNPAITPLRFELGQRPELKPLLRVDGVVVKAGPHWLVSPQTLADLTRSGNPHYDLVANGTLLGTPLGRTVPVIQINIDSLEELAAGRDRVNGFAAVASVDYIHETPTIMGIPEGILEQINYTLDPNTERPEDSFQIWGLNLTGDYSIAKLATDTAQADGRLDREKLRRFVTGVGERMSVMQKDFNIIKAIFYRGELAAADRSTPVSVRRRAKADDSDEEPTSRWVIRTTKVVGHSATPNTAPVTTGASAPSELPETATDPAEGANRAAEINTAGSEKARLLGDWNSYGFTVGERAELKSTPSDRPPFVTISDGTRIGIGAVRWSPMVAERARVILPYTEGPASRRVGDSAKWRERWVGYYGALTDNPEQLNRQRIAELLALAGKIRELEVADSKIY